MALTRGSLSFVVVIFLTLASTGAAQQSHIGDAKPPITEARSAIVANVELVQLSVIVLDDQGAVATGLQEGDFRVVEDRVEQHLLFCDRDRQSVSFVMLSDISESMTRKIPFVRQATSAIMTLLPSDKLAPDEYSLFGIESHVKRLFLFTDDDAELDRRLPALITPTKEGTALFDGIYDGVLTAQREAKNKRRAVIVISDGGDNHSRHSLRQTRRFLQEAGMPVFAVMAGAKFDTEEPPVTNVQLHKMPISIPTRNADYVGAAERAGPGYLKSLTEVSGGSVFTAHDPEALTRITRTISDAVRYQYVLSYESQGTEDVKRKNNNWHEVHLELVPSEKFKGYSVYYKRGYFKNAVQAAAK